MFQKFLTQLLSISQNNAFETQTSNMQKYIDTLSIEEISCLTKEIGTIPEHIKVSSSLEKLYSKSSDIILSKCFQFLGLKSSLIHDRTNSADIIAESNYHRYSLVADAKCFRMSRTAKNQKDFKVSALSNWRGLEHEYSILVCPYFQYPKKESQIYKSALDSNVCLLSWEHLSIMLDNNIIENANLSLETIWNSSQAISRDSKLSFKNANQCLLPKINTIITKKLNIENSHFNLLLDNHKKIIKQRARSEIIYCQNQLLKIEQYTKEEAIEALKKETKMEEKITAIKNFINGL